ncbi:S41 family peptidase [Cellulophaga baltica 4]|nr:S41 family peptidase [Cellulophaga baltica 4]
MNGKKFNKPTFYYNRPVYILANEKTFSAASVFVSAFKGLPNIKIVGVTTDGSSGNSEWVDLPNSKLFGKISTMVSFQKDGQILDGYGTEPDIKIERDINQILWQSDTQLEKLKDLILTEN